MVSTWTSKIGRVDQWSFRVSELRYFRVRRLEGNSVYGTTELGVFLDVLSCKMTNDGRTITVAPQQATDSVEQHIGGVYPRFVLTGKKPTASQRGASFSRELRVDAFRLDAS